VRRQLSLSAKTSAPKRGTDRGTVPVSYASQFLLWRPLSSGFLQLTDGSLVKGRYPRPGKTAGRGAEMPGNFSVTRLY